MSQSPRIGAFLQTKLYLLVRRGRKCLNPLESGHSFRPQAQGVLREQKLSQSPRIGAFLQTINPDTIITLTDKSQSPRIGAFLQTTQLSALEKFKALGLNPLESGHSFRRKNKQCK